MDIKLDVSKINEIVSISSELFAWDTGSNLKQEDFTMIVCNVSVHNSICFPDKPIVKYVRKSIYKSVSTSSVVPSKHISDSNAHSSKILSSSSIRPTNPFMVVVLP